MQFEPLVPTLIASGRLVVDFDTGLIYSPRSNTPSKPLGALTKKGYLRVCLTIDGRQAHALNHRIVWCAANGPVPDGFQVDHVDTKKTHNWLSNLELVTGNENMERAVANGLFAGVGRRDGIRDEKGRFGKARAGRQLDGRTWSEFPSPDEAPSSPGTGEGDHPKDGGRGPSVEGFDAGTSPPTGFAGPPSPDGEGYRAPSGDRKESEP